METLIDLDAADDEAQAVEPPRPAGLPADRHQLVRPAVHQRRDLGRPALFWLRFLEAAIPLWVCDILVLALAVIIIRKG